MEDVLTAMCLPIAQATPRQEFDGISPETLQVVSALSELATTVKEHCRRVFLGDVYPSDWEDLAGWLETAAGLCRERERS